MFIFTGIRYFGIFIFVLIFFRNYILYTAGGLIVGIPIALTFNKGMIDIFGPFFSTVVNTGLKFNFLLFLLGAILTIYVHYIVKYMRKEKHEIITKKSS